VTTTAVTGDGGGDGARRARLWLLVLVVPVAVVPVAMVPVVVVLMVA
jgi:hypothetical protein